MAALPVQPQVLVPNPVQPIVKNVPLIKNALSQITDIL